MILFSLSIVFYCILFDIVLYCPLYHIVHCIVLFSLYIVFHCSLQYIVGIVYCISLYIVSYCIIFFFIVHCIPLYIVAYCSILYLVVYCILLLFILSIVSYRFNLLYHIVLRPYLALQNLKSVHVFTGLRQDGSHQSRGFKGDATASGLFRAQTPRLPARGRWQAAWPPLSRSARESFAA